MPKVFNYGDALGMVTAVCISYVTQKEILEKFSEFKEDKEFTEEEIKIIVAKIVEGKQKKTPGIPPYKWPKKSKKEQNER